MKSEKGVTLTALVIYICVAMVVISIMAVISSNFYTNMDTIKSQDLYAVEFNKFNIFFINDVKNNSEATVEENNTKITFEDGIVYEFRGTDIYRDEVKIASNIQEAKFSLGTPEVIGKTTKNIVQVYLSIGKYAKAESDFSNAQGEVKNRFNKTIEYVLKYW